MRQSLKRNSESVMENHLLGPLSQVGVKGSSSDQVQSSQVDSCFLCLAVIEHPSITDLCGTFQLDTF